MPLPSDVLKLVAGFLRDRRAFAATCKRLSQVRIRPQWRIELDDSVDRVLLDSTGVQEVLVAAEGFSGDALRPYTNLRTLQIYCSDTYAPIYFGTTTLHSVERVVLSGCNDPSWLVLCSELAPKASHVKCELCFESWSSDIELFAHWSGLRVLDLDFRFPQSALCDRGSFAPLRGLERLRLSLRMSKGQSNFYARDGNFSALESLSLQDLEIALIVGQQAQRIVAKLFDIKRVAVRTQLQIFDALQTRALPGSRRTRPPVFASPCAASSCVLVGLCPPSKSFSPVCPVWSTCLGVAPGPGAPAATKNGNGPFPPCRCTT